MRGRKGMYKYETHLHTSPVSACALADVEENLKFYKKAGYEGVFITNHFLDGNINIDKNLSYREKVDFYFSDYEKALELSKQIGITVFLGVELSYDGTDFLIYGLDKEWYISNPQIMDMKKSEELLFLKENGALVIQAHPYRGYYDHIRLYPQCIHGVEVINASKIDVENELARIYAESYNLVKIAGSDNHHGNKRKKLAGVSFASKLVDEIDFVNRVKNGEAEIFSMELE